MRVGIYVDGYNLYYGGRALCGRGTPGWRWLDIRALLIDLLAAQRGWAGAVPVQITYCTAIVNANTNESAYRDQDVYLKALLASGSVDLIEYGHYVARTKKALLAVDDATRAPCIHEAQWPIMVQDPRGASIPGARFMASVLHQEEKGSDVNVATHLVADVLEARVDAAVVVSNDSDLRLPVMLARERVPVGLVNPRGGLFAGDLRGTKDDGVGNHWFRRLGAADLLAHQLPDPAGRFVKPAGW